MSDTQLTCPKCEGEMRTYERNGVVVDQCTRCRGMFLDSGEFEQLMGAESAFPDRQARAAGRGVRKAG